MKSLACGLLLSLFLPAGASAAPPPGPRLALAPCRLPGLEREARCGTGGSSPLLCPAQQGLRQIEEALDTFMSPAEAAVPPPA